VIGSKGATLFIFEHDERVAVGSERNVSCLPPLAAVRVRAAAGLANVSGVKAARVSLSGEIERDAEREELPGIRESWTASLLSLRRALAAEALVGCKSLDLGGSGREG
jgi:hypothetical protein